MNDSLIELNPFDYSPETHLIAKLRRRFVQHTTVAPLGRLDASVITFSFDDFPVSAADNGADILDAIHAKAIYYACSGLAGKTNRTGKQYDDEHIAKLVSAGHEIGAHTHFHIDCAIRPVNDVIADIERNLMELDNMGARDPIDHFAYPYGETSVKLKYTLAKKFHTARGILPGNNAERADRMQLRSMELNPDPMTVERALGAIEKAQYEPCWLNIFTHDVRDTPSDYGITPKALQRVARAARDSALPILPPSKAMAYWKGIKS